MGCASSVKFGESKGKTSTVSQIDGLHGFTDREKHLIKKTWRVLSNNMPGVGANIFLAIFNLNPEVKNIFPCHDVTGEELLRDPNFRGHASRFMQAVGAAVDNIHDLEESMAPLLFRLGQQHIHYEGFKVEFFDIFIHAILKVFESELGTKFTNDVANVWRKVVVFIISQLKRGYVDAITRTDSVDKVEVIENPNHPNTPRITASHYK